LTVVIHSPVVNHRHVDESIERHRRACDGLGAVAHEVRAELWAAPTPCSEWTTKDVVEHVIGFHDFLLIRPLGVRALRPRTNAAARWDATADTLFAALAIEGVLDAVTELPGGGISTPRTMIDALTTDVLVHTWDVARAIGTSTAPDDELCDRALVMVRAAGVGRGDAIGPEVPIGENAWAVDKLVAFYGREPSWSP
jgi:uncharacterized protein (TIGR03086 family)